MSAKCCTDTLIWPSADKLWMLPRERVASNLQFVQATGKFWHIANQLEAAAHGGQHVSNLLQVSAGKSTLNALEQLGQLSSFLPSTASSQHIDIWSAACAGQIYLLLCSMGNRTDLQSMFRELV